MTDRLTKLYMTGVVAIYLLHIVGGLTLIIIAWMAFNGLGSIFPVAVTGLIMMSSLFFVYLTLLKRRMQDMFYEKTVVHEAIKVGDLTDEFDRDLSELDDNDNYV